MGVLGSGSNDLGSGVGGEGSGSGGLGYLETELLIGLDSLKKESREKGDFGPLGGIFLMTQSLQLGFF